MHNYEFIGISITFVIIPIKYLTVYNIGNPNEAFLEVTCNSGTMEQPVEFQWEQVQGVDLSEDRISAKVVKLSLNRCPATSNVSWKIKCTFLLNLRA